MSLIGVGRQMRIRSVIRKNPADAVRVISWWSMDIDGLITTHVIVIPGLLFPECERDLRGGECTL